MSAPASSAVGDRGPARRTTRWLQRIACVIALLGASATPACSVVKLSDDIVLERCESNADCGGLNDPDAEGFPCVQWQCELETGRCELGRADLDGDGYSPREIVIDDETFECEVDADEADCDDDDRERNAGEAERCDDKDNDCDELVDEGALWDERPRRLVLFSGASSGGATAASYAQDAMTGSLAIGYGIEDSTRRPGLSLVDLTTDATDNAAPFDGAAQEVAVATMDGGDVALALVDGARTRRLLAGLASGSGAQRLETSATIDRYGLSCLAEEACAGNAAEPDTAIAAPETGRLALAASGLDVLVSYLRLRGGADRCVPRETAEQPELLLSALVKPAAANRLDERAGGPLSLGTTADALGASLLAVGELGDASARETGWLVAHSDPDGGLQLAQVRVGDGVLELVRESALTMGPASGGRHAAALALGPETDGGRTLGLAQQVGCGKDARITLALFELSVDQDGALSAELLADGLAEDDEETQQDPALVYSRARDAWLLAYTTKNGLRARVLERDGSARGEAPYLLIEREGESLRTLLAPGAVTLTGDDWFGVVAMVQRQSEDPERAFELLPLGCGL